MTFCLEHLLQGTTHGVHFFLLINTTTNWMESSNTVAPVSESIVWLRLVHRSTNNFIFDQVRLLCLRIANGRFCVFLQKHAVEFSGTKIWVCFPLRICMRLHLFEVFKGGRLCDLRSSNISKVLWSFHTAFPFLNKFIKVLFEEFDKRRMLLCY